MEPNPSRTAASTALVALGLALTALAVVAFAPTASAHDCSSALGVLICGPCRSDGSDHRHTGVVDELSCQSCVNKE